MTKQEYKDFDHFNEGSILEKTAMAKAIKVPFKRLWPETYREMFQSLIIDKSHISRKK